MPQLLGRRRYGALPLAAALVVAPAAHAQGPDRLTPRLTDDRWTFAAEAGVHRTRYSHEGNPVTGRPSDGRAPARAVGLGVGYRFTPAMRLVARGAFFDARNVLQAWTPRPAFNPDPASYARDQYGTQMLTFGTGLLVDLPVRRVLLSPGLEAGLTWDRYQFEGRSGPAAVEPASPSRFLRWERKPSNAYLSPSLTAAVPVTRALAVTATGRTFLGDGGSFLPGLTAGVVVRR